MSASSGWIIYHNPKCSKSRAALELLESKGIRPRVVEYLKTPLNEAGLIDLLVRLGVTVKEIVRSKEERFLRLGLDLENSSDLIKALVRYPELMERPIVVCGARAVVARPAELALSLASNNE